MTAAARPRGGALATSALPLVAVHDVALLDLDGVVHLVDDPVPGAAQALAQVRAAGVRLAFVTNNASRAPEEVVARLARWGVPAVVDDVVTAGQAGVGLLVEALPAGAAVLVLGTDALCDAVRAGGLRPVRTEAEQPAAVLQGLDRGLRYADLAEAALALARGVPWVACNTDSSLPTTLGMLPGNGAMVAALVTTTGRVPVSAGKPEPALHAESVRRTGARSPLVVGDRLDTDVLGAVRGGADSLAVLTGVVGLPELLAAPAGRRPAYVGAGLEALLLPQPTVDVEGPVATCAGWSARLVAPARLRLSRDGGPAAGEASDPAPGAALAVGSAEVAALRASCRLAWTDAAVADAADAAGATDLAWQVEPGDEAAAALLSRLAARRPGA